MGRRPQVRWLAPALAATAALLGAGCGGSHHRTGGASTTTTAASSTKLLPNTAPDGGAPNLSAALSRYTDALRRLDAAELCRLQYYVDAGCVSRVRMGFDRLRTTSTQVTAKVISITHDTGGGTVIIETTFSRGGATTTQRDRLGFGSRHGRWFIGTAD